MIFNVFACFPCADVSISATFAIINFKPIPYLICEKFLLLLLLTISAGFTTSSAQKLPPQKETLDVVMKVNKYFMEKYADYRTPSFVRNVTRPSNIWTRGVYYEGLMALYSIYPRAEFYDYAYNWAEYHEWGMQNG